MNISFILISSSRFEPTHSVRKRRSQRIPTDKEKYWTLYISAHARYRTKGETRTGTRPFQQLTAADFQVFYQRVDITLEYTNSLRRKRKTELADTYNIAITPSANI